jgi:RNA polymerase sigma-70 factor (ECF subfamily)
MSGINKYNEKELQELILNNDKLANEAFEFFFDKYSTKLNAYCKIRSNSKEDAEEIFNDTWMKFIEYIKKGNYIESVNAYLHLVARSLIIDKYRKEGRARSMSISIEDEQMQDIKLDYDIEQFIEKEEMLALIQFAAGTLDEKYKDPFMMYWFGELSHKEIAEILHDKPENVKMQCYRAMQKVIKILKPYTKEIKG